MTPSNTRIYFSPFQKKTCARTSVCTQNCHTLPLLLINLLTAAIDNKSLIRCFGMQYRFICLLVFCTLTSPQGTTCKNIQQHYTLKHLIRYIYIYIFASILKEILYKIYPALTPGFLIQRFSFNSDIFVVFCTVKSPLKQSSKYNGLTIHILKYSYQKFK